MKPLKDSADFWNVVWISSRKPLNTITHSIMKKTKNKYHHQVRRCLRSANYIANFKIAEKNLRDDGDLFKELEKARKEGDETALVVDRKLEGKSLMYLQKSMPNCTITMRIMWRELLLWPS